MAPGDFIVLLACFLVGSSATVCIGGNWTSEAYSSLSYQSTSAESERTFVQSSRKGQRVSYERLLAGQFKERDLDHPDHLALPLHASKIRHIREEFLHDHEIDSTSHGFSRAVSLLEVTLGVTCNRQLHVTAIHLSSLNLTGSLGPSLCNLPYLEELHLHQNVLQSEIPLELGRLSRLRILNLEENLLYGSIPKELGNLTSLQVLNLGSQGSRFNGTIPEELGQLSELRFLNLGAVNNWNSEKKYYMTATNELRGTIPRSLGNCTKLWYLDFYGNGHLTGVIPEELGKLIHLEYLSFEQNNFTGAVPHQLGNLTICENLNFRSNRLQGHLPVGLANLSRLVFLDVSWNLFTGNLVHDSSTSWSELLWLIAEGNSFSGTFPELLLSCRNLEALYLNNNNFSGSLPADLGRLSSAKSIYIHNNMFEGELPESLTNVSFLTDLDLSNNKFTGPLYPLRNSTLLEVLYLGNPDLIQNSFTDRLTDERYLSNNKFTGPLDALRNSSLLEVMDLGSPGKIPASLANIQDFTEMDLGNNNLKGSIPRQLGNLTNIRILGLYSNHITVTGLILERVASVESQGLFLRGLQVLSLASNNFRGSIPCSIWKLPALQVLDLSSNAFTGVLPQDLSGLKNYKLPLESKLESASDFLNRRVLIEISLRKGENTLEYTYVLNALTSLDVSRNQLTGELPAELGTLHGLTYLFLADNNLEGSIPTEFGEIVDLLDLDLSKNLLSGSIPVSLSRLCLGYLNLSYNQLCGPIPVANSFDTRFSGSFFPGNPKLCGVSINKPCESSAFSCNGHIDLDPVTELADSWSLYFHGVSMTAFAKGASIGFATIIGLITLIPTLRNKFLFPKYRRIRPPKDQICRAAA
ncbi:hypothetical protein AXG93_3399s1010 [Marchantia polymorpha subsp. ruderalis]|uniref:Disease resistance R13L4/SHOC-2-like LRR domain-containing protein n=1 Tax=Marchantia polymorpha subsp. ruderalis TaxID=1480154 RepID=A0A176VF62_MARPO|nr:hypothetical protein AXG93_3399s1010 [Marchantia polymorpha subsp. ruderalis]